MYPTRRDSLDPLPPSSSPRPAILFGSLIQRRWPGFLCPELSRLARFPFVCRRYLLSDCQKVSHLRRSDQCGGVCVRQLAPKIQNVDLFCQKLCRVKWFWRRRVSCRGFPLCCVKVYREPVLSSRSCFFAMLGDCPRFRI